MDDRPTTRELLTAVEHFLDRDLVSELKGRHQFLARVAANALRMVTREIETAGDRAERSRQVWLQASENSSLPQSFGQSCSSFCAPKSRTSFQYRIRACSPLTASVESAERYDAGMNPRTLLVLQVERKEIVHGRNN